MATATERPTSTSVIDWFWIALPYGLLVVTLAVYALGQPMDPAPGGLVGAIALSALIAIWHGWWGVRNRRELEEAVAPMVVYFLGMLAATTALCAISFTFFPLYLTCFALAFVALPGAWAYVGIAATTLVALVAPWLLTPTFDNLAAIVGGGLLAAGAGWSIRALEASQARLREALIENRELQEQLIDDARSAGTAAERARLGAELHDTIAGELTGVVSQLEAIDAQFELPPGADERVWMALAAARGCLGEVRHTVQALRPVALTGRSLPGALDVVTSGFERSRRIPVELRITGAEVDVPDETAHALLRAAQEALTNVARHAAATRVHVTLSYLQDTVALDIADDGQGMPQRGRPGGQGLRIMRERVAALGGGVVVASETSGTTVTVTAPLGEPDTKDDSQGGSEHVHE